MNPDRSDKLNEILGKFFILHCSLDGRGTFERLKALHAKQIIKSKRDEYIEALIGFVVCPDPGDGSSWVISCAEFESRVQALSARYSSETKLFPTKFHPATATFDQKHIDDSHSRLFVKKIQDIEYHEVVPEAVKDYLYATHTIASELADYAVLPDTMTRYEHEVVSGQLRPLHRQALRTVNDVIKDSQSLYDRVMASTPPAFSGFQDVQGSFRNGVIHIHLDDEEADLKWRLE